MVFFFNNISIVNYIIKTFLLAAGQLKVNDVVVFSNKCWSFLLMRRDSVVAIVAGLDAGKLRNRVSIFHRTSDSFHFSEICGPTLTQYKYPAKRARGAF
jgi:hypothetical protein